MTFQRPRVSVFMPTFEQAAFLPRAVGSLLVDLHTPSEADIADAAAKAEDARHRLEDSRVEMMRGYAETRGCRRAYIPSYFGEDFSPPCGNCEDCLAGLVSPDDGEEHAFEVTSRITHAE